VSFFLKYNSIDYENNLDRFLIFTTDNNLQLMEQCEHWLCDGTFSCVPSIFHQLYTIRGINDSKVVPAVYKLLRNKKEDTYKRMFLAIKFLKPQLNPKSMMFDFEKAAMNASKYVFPSINIKGCFIPFKVVYLATCTIKIKWTTS